MYIITQICKHVQQKMCLNSIYLILMLFCSTYLSLLFEAIKYCGENGWRIYYIYALNEHVSEDADAGAIESVDNEDHLGATMLSSVDVASLAMCTFYCQTPSCNHSSEV